MTRRIRTRWMRRPVLALGALTLSGLLAFGASAESNAPDPWPGLVADLFQGRQMAQDVVVALEAPVRAEDASIVPITLRIAAPNVKKATLVIDQNPMPMAAAFALGPASAPDFISVRARVNSYTSIHAVAETADGALHAQVKFVKAAGGCSAPAAKNPDEATAHLGEMKYRAFKSADPMRREAQIIIRHPNNSGMQMDQLSHLYIPAHYIDRVEVRQGSELIFSMEGGISLSEDPNFRFSYKPTGARTISVEAHDTRGNVFKGEWPIADAS